MNETDQCLLARQGRPRRAIGRLRDVNSSSRQVISPQQPVTAEPTGDDHAHRDREPDAGRHCRSRGDAPVARTGEHRRAGPTGQRRSDRPPTVTSSAVAEKAEQQHPDDAGNGTHHDGAGSCRERFTVDRPQRTRTPTRRRFAPSRTERSRTGCPRTERSRTERCRTMRCRCRRQRPPWRSGRRWR